MSRPGILRHRVELWRKPLADDTAAQDAYGQTVAPFALVGEYWASIEPLRGEEYFQNMQVQGGVSHRIFVRANAGVRNKDELRMDGRVFRVAGVFDVKELGEYQEIMATELAE
jgi:SPP1 family predicted phage head-tail adaptor